MLSHHKKVYDELQREFPDADVYIGTSDKVEGSKSPFDFKEKQLIAQAHGIDPKKVLMAKRPYHKDDYSTYFDEENTHIFFAVGEKDLDRFPFNNVDEKTGLDMTVRGEPKPKYYQKINTYKQDPQPMSMRGYITLAPTIQLGDEIASASAFRDALQNAPDLEKAKEIYTKQFGEFDQKVFDLIYNKIKGSKMSEDINIMRKLAGLAEAPVDFNTEANPKEVTFLEPSKSSSKMSIANRFPPDVDTNDPEVKKEQFIDALMKAPANLLSEINERLDPKDSNNEAVGARLDDIISKLQKMDNIGQLENDDKMFVVDVVKVAIKDMFLVAGDDSQPEFDDEQEDEYLDWDDEISKSNKTSAAVGNIEPIEDSVNIDYDYNASLDLSDIKDAYGVERQAEGKVKDLGMDQVEAFYDKVSALVDDNNDLGKAVVDAWSDEEENPPEWALDDETRAILVNAGKIEQEQEEPAELESFDPSMEPGREQVAYDEAMDALEKGGEEGLAKHLGMSEQELDQEINQWCAEHGKHADDDREEAIDGVLDDVISNADWDDYYEGIEEETKMSKTAQEYYDLGVEHGKKGIYKNPPYGIGAPAVKAYSKGVKAGEAMKNESVEKTTDNALAAAIQELRTLAGLNS